jgi:hypothetical protein
LEAQLQALHLAVGQHDVWSFIWGNSVYSSSKFYALVFKNMVNPLSLGYGSLNAHPELNSLVGYSLWTD